MRNAIFLAAVVVFAACHKPRPLTARAADLGKKVVAIVKPVADVKVKIDASVVADLAKQQVANRVGTMQPISIHKSVKSSSSTTPTEEPPPTVTPTVTRTVVDTGSDQVWRNIWRDGERATCEKVATFDECQAACTEHMRGQSMRQLDKNAGKPEQCQCTQGNSMCK